ncbi:PUB50 [Symbiodinium microadriaticum]|nr:PUB50 [Symbiodinium microadriaticum]
MNQTGTDSQHSDGEQNSGFVGEQPTQLLLDRWTLAKCMNHTYLAVGDGANHIQTEYFPFTRPLDNQVIEQLQHLLVGDLDKEECTELLDIYVLAADGFTYERQAIEKWLSMHNTSPMTGAVLAHRYLTENFALRHLIETYEAQLSEKRTTEGRRAGVSKTCISPPLSELSDEADSYMEEEWSNEAPSRRMVRMEEDMPILSHQVDDG